MALEITYYGHSCFGVKAAGKHLLFDPFITGNPKAAHIDIKQLQADYVLISHAHGDHLADALTILKNTQACLISNFEIASYYEAKGVKRTEKLNFGGRVATSFGHVRMVHAMHSSQFPDGTYGGNPGGFVVESGDGNFYFAGDTALTLDLQLIPRYATLKLAFLPIGGYFTMDYHDAAIAAEFLQCDTVIGMHYDSFPPITIDHEAALKVFAEQQIKLLLLKVGERITI
ncbi:MAG: metal-dependent hydrolase [Chitinophagales bacterium]|nr:metal-dependent hydrolase [Chitinophagales bacterium]MDW8427072.1 metal-dependent hydrolase [Chitinophagales bacterium]